MANQTELGDKALVRLQDLGVPAEDLALLDKAKQLSDDLIALEEEAFKAAETGDFDTARRLIFGPAYDAELEKINAPIAEFQRRVKERAGAAVAEASNNADIAMTIINVLTAIGRMNWANWPVPLRRCAAGRSPG
ncbi:MAG TPA: hypothetical protein VD902_12010 [Symbiobacteriaceae bacterium]|nr:hypothetical protein [Symbiobacteriaceae bacterium]